MSGNDVIYQCSNGHQSSSGGKCYCGKDLLATVGTVVPSEEELKKHNKTVDEKKKKN